MYKLSGTLLIMLLVQSFAAKAQRFEVDTLQYNGSTSAYINFVILGDGYTAGEQKKFESDAQKFNAYFFSQAPYVYYKNYFNVFIIKVPSPESGVKHPHNANDCPADMPAADPNNFFGSTFDRSGIHRLVALTNTSAAGLVLAENFPGYDQVVMLANSDFYGGSGGNIPLATVNMASNEIAVHEIGHSFGGLSDEYWAGAGYVNENVNLTQEVEPSLVKWKNWIGTNGVGIYSYGGKSPLSVWYRPHENCKMQILGMPFCSVCAEAIIEKIHNLVSPVLSTLPAGKIIPIPDSVRAFSVKLIKPVPNTLKTQWYINDRLVAVNTDVLPVEPALFTNDTATVKFTVIDTTAMLRADEHFINHLYTHTWRVAPSAKPLAAPKIRWSPLEVCTGTGTVLSVINPEPAVQYNWYTDSVGGTLVATGANFLSPVITGDVNYYAEARNGANTSKRARAIIKALPVPAAPLQVVAEQSPVCFGTTARMKILSADPGLGYRWYTSGKGMQSAGDDTMVVTAGLTAAATYYVGSFNRLTGCFSAGRTKIMVAVTNKITAPVVTVAQLRASTLTFSWQPVSGAAAYQVSTDSGTSFHEPTSGRLGLSHTIRKLKVGQRASIIVRALNAENCMADVIAAGTATR